MIRSWWNRLSDPNTQRTLTFLGTTLSAIVAIGWGAYVYLYPAGSVRHSALALAIRSPTQVPPILSKAPWYRNEPVFCDAVRFDLVASHDQAAENPIRITQLAFQFEPIKQNDSERAVNCQIDLSKLEPHGIVELRQYRFSIFADRAEARYLESLAPDGAWRLNPKNLFQSKVTTEAVTLKSKDDDAHYQIVGVLEAMSDGLYRARFKALYDVAGSSREAESSWLYILKSGPN